MVDIPPLRFPFNSNVDQNRRPAACCSESDDVTDTPWPAVLFWAIHVTLDCSSFNLCCGGAISTRHSLVQARSVHTAYDITTAGTIAGIYGYQSGLMIRSDETRFQASPQQSQRKPQNCTLVTAFQTLRFPPPAPTSPPLGVFRPSRKDAPVLEALHPARKATIHKGLLRPATVSRRTITRVTSRIDSTGSSSCSSHSEARSLPPRRPRGCL